MNTLGEIYDASQGNLTGMSVLSDDFGCITIAQEKLFTV